MTVDTTKSTPGRRRSRTGGSEPIDQDLARGVYLAMLAGRGDGLLEARYRMPSGGMGQLFHPAARWKAINETIGGLGQRTDVYVGAAPRTHRHGGASAIDAVWTLWVDCDDRAAVDALEDFRPAPAVVILTGSGPNRHAFWPLRESLTAEQAVRANRRLAHALGADMRSTDAARILRPPGTLNHKHDPPRPVECVRCEVVSHLVREVVGPLPDPPAPHLPVPASAPPVARSGRDPLLEIPAAEYVPALIGRPVGRDGKAQCPWHAGGQERTPSLHAYAEAEAGWWCYSCDRGGTLIDFGAALYGIEPRGRGYHEVRRRLAADLLGAAEAA